MSKNDKEKQRRLHLLREPGCLIYQTTEPMFLAVGGIDGGVVHQYSNSVLNKAPAGVIQIQIRIGIE